MESRHSRRQQKVHESDEHQIRKRSTFETSKSVGTSVAVIENEFSGSLRLTMQTCSTLSFPNRDPPGSVYMQRVRRSLSSCCSSHQRRGRLDDRLRSVPFCSSIAMFGQHGTQWYCQKTVGPRMLATAAPAHVSPRGVDWQLPLTLRGHVLTTAMLTRRPARRAPIQRAH